MCWYLVNDISVVCWQQGTAEVDNSSSLIAKGKKGLPLSAQICYNTTETCVELFE